MAYDLLCGTVPIIVIYLYIQCSHHHDAAHPRRAKDHKVKNNYASAVISMSIAGPRSAALNDAVEAAVAAGMTVVAAAGEQPMAFSAQHQCSGLAWAA